MLQNSQENTCATDLFLINLQAFLPPENTGLPYGFLMF